MSRLIVKGLPKYLTAKRLKEHFSQKGDVTDAKIAMTKSNTSRQFGFVGFRTAEQAQEALRYFNNTFIDTSRIHVEEAKAVGDPSIPKPWSKYTDGTTAHKRLREHDAEVESRSGKRQKTGADDGDDDGAASKSAADKKKQQQDAKLAEFLELSKPKSRVAYWGDQSVAQLHAPSTKKPAALALAASDDGADEQEREFVPWDDDDSGDDGDDDDVFDASAKANKNSSAKTKKQAAAAGGTSSKAKASKEQPLPQQQRGTGKSAKAIRALLEDDDEDDEQEAGSELEYNSDDLADNDNDDEDDEEQANLEDDEDGSEQEYDSDDLADNDNDDDEDEEQEQDDDDDEPDDEDDEDDEDDDAISLFEDDEPASSKKKKKQRATDGDDDQASGEGEEEDASEHDDLEDHGRLYVRNLPYTATEEDLTSLFGEYGELDEVHLSIDAITKQPKGFAFITFKDPKAAIIAMSKLNSSSFMGRLLHVIPAKPAVEHTKHEGDARGGAGSSSFKEQKKQKLKENRENQVNWNALFIRSDTVANATAEKLKVKKGELLDPSSNQLAVRLALAETNIIQETKQILEDEGVDLEALGSFSKKDVARSNRVLLVKNLPHSTTLADLQALFSPFGTLGRVVLPPTRAIALVEFLEVNEAKKAMRTLAYKPFKHVPLYLEWAPMGVFRQEQYTPPKDAKSSKKEAKRKEQLRDNVLNLHEEEATTTQTTTLYVKNLNFETTEESLKALFARIGRLRSVTIAHKKDAAGKQLSLGFGFVEFFDKADAIKAIKKLQGVKLDDHALALKFSAKSLQPQTSERKRKPVDQPNEAKSSKLVVRNVAFEATARDIRSIFQSFGELKAVRIPKKFDGKSRGFAFVEFVTKQDAKRAMDNLKHTHLYGRHLVIEYAEQDKSLEQLREKAKEDLSKL